MRASRTTREQIDEVNQAIALKESGFASPAIAESPKVRKEAIARAQRRKSANDESTASNAKSGKTGAMELSPDVFPCAAPILQSLEKR